MNAGTAKSVLSVNLSSALPTASKQLETKSGLVRWALLDGALLIHPEREIDPSDTAHIEHLVRAVMKSSGLARRYQIFSFHDTGVTGR